MALTDDICAYLQEEKERHHESTAMAVAIEGLSSTGKTTLAQGLTAALSGQDRPSILVEGDTFQQGISAGMQIYYDIFAALDRGEPVPEEFPDRIWDYGKLRREMMLPLGEFNAS